MNPALRPAFLGVLVAIAVTTAMDATGLSAFSALPLLPLMGAFWIAQRFTRREMGFTLGRAGHHGLALLHPLLVLGAATLIAALAGAIDTSATDWRKAGLKMAIGSAATVIAVILTEEGFFRGWLWASLARAGLGGKELLAWSSIAFALWHVSAVTLETGFDLPPEQIPVFLVNAAMMGAIWGMLRLHSGSVVVASLSHGLWNGLAYTLFGFGTRSGALGISATGTYGPEVGFVGLALNIGFAAMLWRRLGAFSSPTPDDSPDAD